MKLEVGKYYKTRDGRKVGPMVEDFEGDYMALHPDLGYLVTWQHDGARWRHEPGLDIVSEWPTNPTTGTLAELGVKPGDVVSLTEGGPILHDMIGLEATVDHDGHAVLKNGSYFDPVYDEEYGRKYRLVSRASDSRAQPTGPVITETVTRKRIVSGVYGRISIHKNTYNDGKVLIRLADGAGEVNLNNCGHYMSRAELIAARDILSQLIDAMDSE